MTAARHFPRLFEPISIGSLTIRNRLVNPTHGTALGLERDIEYFRARARGGVGMIGLHSSDGAAGFGVGHEPEADQPRWDERALDALSDAGIEFYDARTIPGLTRLADAIHAEGAACFAQVYHPGAARHGEASGPVIAPSSVVDPYEAYAPHALTTREIDQLVWAFAHQIRRIWESGVDAAEIHGAHGYLVNQFLSPYANRRTDAWGGSRERRVAFVTAIIQAARTLVPASYPIGVRIGVDGDGDRRGITVAELAGIGALLAPHCAYLNVSGGNYAGIGDGPELAYVSPWYREPAFNAPAAAAVRSVVDVPVIVTGRVTDLSTAETLVRDGVADLVGMVRALIADPDLPRKEREGRSDDVRMCLGLSECHAIGPHRTPITCAVNAAAGREAELTLVSTRSARTVAVVGAGPAGMEAARVAAQRGHRVYLADSRRELGGTPAVLARDDNRRNLRDHVAFFEVQLAKLGVELLLGHAVAPDDVADFEPDVVVVATGGRPVVPDVPGITAPHVVHALDVLQGAEIRERVVVVGGFERHLGPPTVAEHLADRGCDVELISEQMDFADAVEHGTRIMLAQRLRSKGVRTSQFSRLTAVDSTGVEVLDTATRTSRRIDGVTVVLACGLEPATGLAVALEGRVPELHVVGDALAPRRIMHATLDGARVGSRI